MSVTEENQQREMYYRVSRVIDGDTIDVEKNGVSVRVRLIGMDTPETVDPRRPVECFGKEASGKAKELLEGKLVRLETDPSQGRYDRYKRMLVYVYLSDGTFFNKGMISDGYAHEYTYRLPYRYQAEFKAAERVSREEKRGLWADGVCPH
jgi:micrococcal nuclease